MSNLHPEYPGFADVATAAPVKPAPRQMPEHVAPAAPAPLDHLYPADGVTGDLANDPRGMAE